jgi:very-short-patch-repair endonuclease
VPWQARSCQKEQDDCLFFLAVDFDKDAWMEDVKAFRETCQRMNIPSALERSRSGNGAHIWFFFCESAPARLARNLGSMLLTETMESRPDIGLSSYDRLFPNQDTMPRGGYGNLIALPLQKRARARGNSVFLDEQLTPCPDQWAFLASVEKANRAKVEAVAREAESRGRVLGVRPVLTLEDRTAVPQAAGIDHARSASKAFLFRRLETLSETAGRFRLNVELPIAFNEKGGMEIDLLRAETKIAIEIDGPQHLADLDAYRRDRRKDALLQENGYFVLRFLAEDIGRRLDEILDAIPRAMVHRGKCSSSWYFGRRRQAPEISASACVEGASLFCEAETR